jgi:phage terminase small subunit
MAKLTPKQEFFCREYIVDLNATQAAVRSGYSEKTANRIASQLLSKLDIQTFIAELMGKRNESVDISAEYVLKRLKEIDELDVIDILNDDLDGFKRLSEWPKSWRTSISGLDIQTVISGGDEPIEKLVRKIKWPDKTKNLELIGRHVDVKAWDGDSTGSDLPIGKIEIEVVGANNKD